jgi:hypothetical protein
MKKPVRRSAARGGNPKAAAAKPSREDNERLVLKLPPAAKRAIKARAAFEGVTVAAYVVRLARADGVDIPELPEMSSED